LALKRSRDPTLSITITISISITAVTLTVIVVVIVAVRGNAINAPPHASYLCVICGIVEAFVLSLAAATTAAIIITSALVTLVLLLSAACFLADFDACAHVYVFNILVIQCGGGGGDNALASSLSRRGTSCGCDGIFALSPTAAVGAGSVVLMGRAAVIVTIAAATAPVVVATSSEIALLWHRIFLQCTTGDGNENGIFSNSKE
jgi:hypothetical protein